MTHRALSPTSPWRLPCLCLVTALLIFSQACGAETTDADADTSGTETSATAQTSDPSTSPTDGDSSGEAAETAEPFDPSTLPTVVARIDDREITRDELLEEARGARDQLVQSGVPEEATRTREFYGQALDQLMADILLFEEAQAEDLVPSDEEVNQRLATLQSQVPEGKSFEDLLAAQGMTRAELTEELRRSGALQKIIETKIAPQISVDEAKAREFYQENLDRMQIPPRVKARHILLKVSPDAGEEAHQAARQKARDLRSQIEQGGDFAALAREHSEDQTSAEQGGELPWLMPGQTVPAFDQAIFSLEPGQLGPVVESRYGYHVVQTLDKQDGQTASFEQVKDRILARLRQQEGQQRLHDHVDQLKAAHEVEIHL